MNEAVLLVNMGGPARRQDVEPYLRSIFRDPAIISLPGVVREPLANLIAMRRASAVADRYELIGGYTPLFHWSGKLRSDVKAILTDEGAALEVQYAFRYMSPTIEEAFASLKLKNTELVRVLPLFPHYTHTMTGSVMKEARRVAANLQMEVTSVDDWGLDRDVLDLLTCYMREALSEAGAGARVLFVAHGIPQLYVKRGDDYPNRVCAVAQALGDHLPQGTEWSVAFQSKVGPLKWTGPYMEDEIRRLAESNAPLVIMPLSFVADCLETLYDLDIVARRQANELGITQYVRARVFNDDPRFARIVARMVRELEYVG